MNRLLLKPSLAVLSVTFLATFAGPCLAQDNDRDDAFLPSQVWSISTVPSNGDVNPYGVVFVPNNFNVGAGPLHHGDILVSNFNNCNNLQGTGSTIVDISHVGVQSLFFQFPGITTCNPSPVPPPFVGLTTALGTLRAGFIIVGNGPTTDGTAATAMPGSLLVINNQGTLVNTITDPTIQYPWDMALVDNGTSAIAFVTNALTGTVTRLNLHATSTGFTLVGTGTIIASGYRHQSDPQTLFNAPTGLVYIPDQDVLYVASSQDNAVFAVQNAAERSSGGRGQIIYQDNAHLHGALAMTLTPNGDFLVTNNDSLAINPNPNMPSEIVEFTKNGQFVKEISVDPAFGGSFGLAARVGPHFPILAAVDDNIASIFIWHISEH